ncbi:hypothetical protein [Scytonema sp. NUACC26]|uniref:hypothetical protein n=1 Tax=Scytonema sp. NUACC26 TaxID=3140176 RepID=UPI0034DC1E61
MSSGLFGKGDERNDRPEQDLSEVKDKIEKTENVQNTEEILEKIKETAKEVENQDEGRKGWFC